MQISRSQLKKNTQTNHSTLFDESPDINILIDSKDYKIIKANKAARKFFKTLRTKKKEKYLPDLFPAQISDRLIKGFKKNSTKKSFKMDSVKLLGSNRKSLKMKIEVVRTKIKNQKFLEVRLIENKKEISNSNINDELRTTRQKLKSLFDNNPLMIFIVNEKGIIHDVNRLWSKRAWLQGE